MFIFLPLTKVQEWEWVRERAYPIRCEDTQGIVAYDENGSIQACVVLDSFTVDACSAHIAIDNPFVIRHGFLHEVARHVFIACNRKRLFGLVPANNEKALKLDLHMGFEEVARIPDAYASGVDYIVIRMERQNCRWLPQEVREAA